MAEAWDDKKTVCYLLRCIQEKCAIAAGSASDPLTVVENCQAAVEMCNEAAGMAKRMDAKLREYKADYAKTFYDKVGEK